MELGEGAEGWVLYGVHTPFSHKIINQYLKQQNIETPYIVEDNYVGIKQSNTPTNTPIITV